MFGVPFITNSASELEQTLELIELTSATNWGRIEILKLLIIDSPQLFVIVTVYSVFVVGENTGFGIVESLTNVVGDQA